MTVLAAGFGETDEGAGADPFETGAHDLGMQQHCAATVLLGTRRISLHGLRPFVCSLHFLRELWMDECARLLPCIEKSRHSGSVTQQTAIANSHRAHMILQSSMCLQCCSDGGCWDSQLQPHDVSCCMHSRGLAGIAHMPARRPLTCQPVLQPPCGSIELITHLHAATQALCRLKRRRSRLRRRKSTSTMVRGCS